MRYLLLLILSVITTANWAQHHKQYIEPSPKEVLQTEIADECFFINKYTKTERLRLYPFNKAKRVELISFKEDGYIPVKNKVINKQRVLEKAVLDSQQTDSLTSLLYNVGFTPIAGIRPWGTGHKCYEPRNGILFIDAAGKVFEYIEICFVCEGRRKSSERFNDGQYCYTKYDLLRNFFSSAGIKYGIEEHNPVLNYKEIFKLDTTDIVFNIEIKLKKKTKNGTDLNSLNEIERTLFLTTNADKIYNHHHLTGLAQFYLGNSGNYYEQTLTELKKIGAYKTLKVLEMSKLQWPEGKIPGDIAVRRAVLLKMINIANLKWEKLEKGLFDYEDEIGGQVLTSKEDLRELIFNFATSHRDKLRDE